MSKHAYYSLSRIAIAYRFSDTEDCYILLVLFIFIIFFRKQIFRRPWTDFRETLPHDAVCSEIDCILWGVHVPLKIWDAENTHCCQFADPSQHFEPHHSTVWRKSGNLKQ